MDNSNERLTEIFFYGLYMDDDILRERGIVPRNKRVGTVYDHRLRIGKYSTLMREVNTIAYGIICSLKHDEIHTLYTGCGLNHYVPEAVIVKSDEHYIPALCYVLENPPSEEENNEAYFQKLSICMKQYGMPVPEKV